MLTVNNTLSSYTLAAGEPFVMEVQLLDSAGRGVDINDEAMFLTFYTAANRAIVSDYTGSPAQYEGERFSDDTGEYFRWAFDGRFSEGMYRLSGVRVELAQRLRFGRKIIATGVLIVQSSAISVPSLPSEQIADFAIRVTIKAGAMLGSPPTLTVGAVAFEGDTNMPPPAPVFTSNPSIAGTPQVGQVLTGMDGTITGGTVVSRRWLLAGAAVSTAQMYAATAAGSLVFEVTATGPGGTTVAASDAVAVAEAGVSPSAKSGQIGFNTISDNSQGPPSFLYLNRMKSSSNNGLWNNNTPVSQYGYPTAAGGAGQGTATYVTMRRPTSGKIMHALRHNGVSLNWRFDGEDGITIEDASNPNFVVFSVAAKAGSDFCRPLIALFGATAWPDYRPGNPMSTRDGIAIYELALDADYLAGKQFHPAAVAAYATYHTARWMDVQKTNNSFVRSLADRTPIGYVSYSVAAQWGPPLEVMVELCNEAGCGIWVNVPYRAPADYVQWMLETLRDRCTVPVYLEFGNEVWNSAAGFNESFAYVAQVGHDVDPAWGNGQGYGYLAAQMMIQARQVFGDQSSRLSGVFARQAGAPETATSAAVGVERLGYKVRDLFDALAIGFYTSGGVQDLAQAFANGDNSARTTILAEVERFEATGISQQLVDQMRHGNGLEGWPNSNTLDLVANDIEQGRQFCLAQGIKHLWGYEGQDFHSSQLAFGDALGFRINRMMEALHNDPRIAGTSSGSYERDKFAMMRSKGMGMHMILTDFGPLDQYGAWRTKEHIFSANTPLWDCYQFLQTGGEDIAFAINPLGGTALTVGVQAERVISSYGGNAPVSPVSIKSGTVPGMAIVNGILTGEPLTTGEYTLVYGAFDALGREATLSVTYTVAAAPVYASFDFFSFKPIRTASDVNSNPPKTNFTSLSSFRALDANNQTIPFTPSGDQQGSYPLTNLTDGNDGTVWYASGETTGEPRLIWYGKFSGKGAPAAFVMRGNGGYSPADFEIRGHNGTPPTDNSVPAGGVLLVSQTGRGVDFWAAGDQTFAVT